jgi:alanyl-tRNA synthetase
MQPEHGLRYDKGTNTAAGSKALGGQGGGGRPDMAQAGGPNAAEAEAALSAIEQALETLSRAA